MNIDVKVIPHSGQRLGDVGDWYFDDTGTLIVRVSSMRSWRLEFLVAIHEIVEAALCRFDEVDYREVDKYQADANDKEPGDDPGAPYVDQHCFAIGIERLLAARLDVLWRVYERQLDDIANGST